MWTRYPTPPTSSITRSGFFSARRPVRRPIMTETGSGKRETGIGGKRMEPPSAPGSRRPILGLSPSAPSLRQEGRQNILVDLDSFLGAQLLERGADQPVGFSSP